MTLSVTQLVRTGRPRSQAQTPHPVLFPLQHHHMKDGGAQETSYCAEEMDELTRGPDQGVVSLARWVLGRTGRQSRPSSGPGKEEATLGSDASVQTGLEGNPVTRGISFTVTEGSSKAHCLPKWCLSEILSG